MNLPANETVIPDPMTEPRFPNLFIVGAPKCGTSAMSHYLAAHPDIYMSEQSGVKEPHFFLSGLEGGKHKVMSREQYLALFKPAPATVQYLGEASVNYMYWRGAVQKILELSPTAKLIAMIRNPVDLAHSLHSQLIRQSLENIFDFEKAWRLQNQRSLGRQLPLSCPDFNALQYGERASLGSQVQRLFQNAPREQIHVIVYSDFATDTAGVYNRVLDFLNLECDSRAQFPIVNERIQYRAPAIQKYLVGLKGLRQRLGLPGGLGIHKAINQINEKSGKEPLRPEFRRELQEYFRDEIELLSNILNRDFSHWLK